MKRGVHGDQLDQVVAAQGLGPILDPGLVAAGELEQLVPEPLEADAGGVEALVAVDAALNVGPLERSVQREPRRDAEPPEIGRASCRERV